MRELLFLAGFDDLERLPGGSGLVKEVLGEALPDVSVADYLDSGVNLVVSGRALDVVHNETPIGLRGIDTDGVWVWPRQLGYYVRTYGVPLPEAFLIRAREARTVPAIPDAEVTEILQTFWKTVRESLPYNTPRRS